MICNTKRKYVDVICLNDTEGNIKPLYVIWNGEKKIPIIKIQEICWKSSLKSGGSGLRYKCLFEHNAVGHLYLDRGKWYVEVHNGSLA